MAAACELPPAKPASRIRPCYFLIRFQAVCERVLRKELCGKRLQKEFAKKVLRKEFAKRVKSGAVQCGLSNRSGGMSCNLCKKNFSKRVLRKESGTGRSHFPRITGLKKRRSPAAAGRFPWPTPPPLLS